MKGTGPAVPALPAKNGPGGTCKAVFVFKNPSGIKEKNEKSRRGKGRGLAACRCAPPHAVPSGSTAADATAPRWPLAFGFRAFGPPPEELAHRGRTVRNTAQIRRFRNRPNHARGRALCEPVHPKNAEFCTRAPQVGGVAVRRFPPQDFAPYPVRPPGPVPGGPSGSTDTAPICPPEVLNRCAKPGNFATGRGRRGAAERGRASTVL